MNLFAQTPAMADKRRLLYVITAYLRTCWNINFKEICRPLELLSLLHTVTDSSILERYLDVKHIETCVNVTQFFEFAP